MGDKPLWVFGYGSLVWNPGFPSEENCIARLHGFARSFCMRSIHHRGTVAQPGLVLALDKLAGSCCDGVAWRVPDSDAAQTLRYLRERELISSAYLEATLEVQLKDGRQVTALTFIVDTQHDQYCGGLPLEEQAGIIANATGGRGPNPDYLYNTAQHLAELGINDPELETLMEMVKKSLKNARMQSAVGSGTVRP